MIPKHYVRALCHTLKRWGWTNLDNDENKRRQVLIWLQSNIGLSRAEAKELLKQALEELKRSRG